MAKRKATDDGTDADAPTIDFSALEYPRWVHKDGEQKRVEDAEACEAAYGDGWVIHPTS